MSRRILLNLQYLQYFIFFVTIQEKPITITANDQSIMWGNDLDNRKYVTTGLAEGDSIAELIFTSDTTELTDSGVITISGAKIVNADGKDVAENYVITYESAKLVIEHNTTLLPSKIEVSKEDVDYIAGEILNTDDLTVTAFYEDGYSEVVTDYTTNVDELDMTTVGEKTLIVSFTKNGGTVTKDIVIRVSDKDVVNPPEDIIAPIIRKFIWVYRKKFIH